MTPYRWFPRNDRPKVVGDPVANGGFYGGGLGILMAANALGVGMFLTTGNGEFPTSPLASIGAWIGMLVLMTLCAGVGAMLMAAGLTALLRRLEPRFGRRRDLFLAAVAIGLPLGLANLGITLLLILPGAMNFWFYDTPNFLLILIAAALASGVGLGLGSALAVPFRAREEPSDD